MNRILCTVYIFGDDNMSCKFDFFKCFYYVILQFYVIIIFEFVTNAIYSHLIVSFNFSLIKIFSSYNRTLFIRIPIIGLMVRIKQYFDKNNIYSAHK